MTEDHSVEIALLTHRLGSLETELKAHREESRSERAQLQAELTAQSVKMQTLIDAWNSATLLGKLLGVLGTIATIVGAFAAIRGIFK